MRLGPATLAISHGRAAAGSSHLFGTIIWTIALFFHSGFVTSDGYVGGTGCIVPAG